jgi:small-conductance mechanosensitive channel
MSTLIDRVGATIGISGDILASAAGTIAVLIAWVVLGRLSRRVIARTVDDSASRFHISRVTGYGIAIAAMLLTARLWISGINGLATYLGLASAGVAIALQDPLTNLAGWLFILIRRPFKVGDRIQVGNDRGDVVDIRPFRFIMLEVGNWVHADQGTGRTLHVPNGSIFKHAIANYDEAFGHIWNELEVTVTYESDWRLAKKTLQEILNANTEKIDEHIKKRIEAQAEVLHIRFPTPTPVVWTSVVDSGIRLTMRYFCQPRARRVSAAQIWEEVLDAFAKLDNVDFAYPTARRFDNMTEGKVGARASLPSGIAPSKTRD